MRSKILFLLLISGGLFQSYLSPAQETLPTYTQARKFAGQAVEQLLFSQSVSPNYFNKGVKFFGTSIRRVGVQTGTLLTRPTERNKPCSISKNWRPKFQVSRKTLSMRKTCR
jgi:hypothetical protein